MTATNNYYSISNAIKSILYKPRNKEEKMGKNYWITFYLDYFSFFGYVNNLEEWQSLVEKFGYKQLISVKRSAVTDMADFGDSPRHDSDETLGAWLKKKGIESALQVDFVDMPVTCKLFGNKIIARYDQHKHADVNGAFLFWSEWKENEHLLILGDKNFIPHEIDIARLANYFNWPLPEKDADGAGTYENRTITEWESSYYEIKTPDKIKTVVENILLK